MLSNDLEEQGVIVQADFHVTRLTEPCDLWYQGSGTIVSDRNVGFGHAGRPSFAHRDPFRVIER